MEIVGQVWTASTTTLEQPFARICVSPVCITECGMFACKNPFRLAMFTWSDIHSLFYRCAVTLALPKLGI